MSWIDTHTHLDRIEQDSVPSLLERAKLAQVDSIVTVGMDSISSLDAVALSEQAPQIYAAVGVHPWKAAEVDAAEAVSQISKIAETRQAVAIGEIGLDYEDNLFTGDSYHSEASRQIQRNLFRRQLDLAKTLRLPVIIHSRGGAHTDITNILSDYASPGRAIIQFLSGTPEDVARYVDLGCYFSLGGPVTDPRLSALREAVATIPVNRVVLETDAPYVPPLWKWQSPSEPSDLPAIGTYVAAILDVPLTVLRAETTRNALTVLKLS